MEAMTPEEIEELKTETLEDLFEFLLGEIMDSQEYVEVAYESKDLNNPQLTAMLIAHSKDEVRHGAELVAIINTMVGNLKGNSLAPLYENVLSWHEKVKKKVEAFK